MRPETPQAEPGSASFSRRLRAHFAIARFDHITKNVFVLPGLIVALSATGADTDISRLLPRFLLGMLACTLVACSNYVINEVLDAPYDRFHPTKRLRPTVSGLVSIPIAKMQWVLMGALGVWLGFSISSHFGIACVSLWLMGCVYNIEPLRTKDVAYLDVPSESVNNPIRLLMGWYIVTDDLVPPISLVIGYWMVGCYFMAVKRFSEFREIGQSAAAAYRRSFRRYSEQSLLVSVMFYASAAMLFFGAFIARYRLELVLGFPLIALVMAIYLLISYEPGSAVQHPERLHSDWRLMLPVVVTSVVLCVLLFVDVPGLYTTFTQTVFKGVGRSR